MASLSGPGRARPRLRRDDGVRRLPGQPVECRRRPSRRCSPPWTSTSTTRPSRSPAARRAGAGWCRRAWSCTGAGAAPAGCTWSTATRPSWRSSWRTAAGARLTRSTAGSSRARWTAAGSARRRSRCPGDLPLGYHTLARSDRQHRAAARWWSPRLARAPGAAAATGAGGSPRSSTASARAGRGASATWTTSPTWRPGRAPSSAPTTCWSTRCTPPSRCRRWSRRRTCHLAPASSTRSTCGSRTSPSTPSCRPPPRDGRRPRACTPGSTAPTIDRDTAWAAKREALRRARRRAAPDATRLARFRDRQGEALQRFATWSVLAERARQRLRGLAGGAAGPAGRGGGRRGGARRRGGLRDAGCSGSLDEQLRRPQAKAVGAGMALGTMHDLAVGVHPGGADAWRMRSTYAGGVQVGAPPDPFNQLGQDWSQPPWRPDRLAELGYAPFRDLVAAVLRHAGGVRVDHVIGLFRLWWIPAGPAAGPGHLRQLRPRGAGRRAGPGGAPGRCRGRRRGPRRRRAAAREYLRRAGILGTSILWFERDGDGDPLPAERWRELLPRVGDDPRPAADRRLPRRRPRRAPRPARAARAGWRTSSPPTTPSGRPGWPGAPRGLCPRAPTRARPCWRCTATWR